MNNKTSLPLKEIAKLADDIRLIRDFAENHNFDSELLSAEVTSTKHNFIAINDWALFGFIASLILVICVIAILKFNSSIAGNTSSFLFVIGILFATLATACAHMKLNNITTTIVIAIGLFLVLFIGAGIYTPQEAVNNLKEFKR